MATRMQQRRGTAAQWTAANPILAAGEIGFETDTSKFKMGNGSSAWTALTYFANAAELTALIDGAPELLNTLGELADAIGEDPAFFTSVANNLSAHSSDTTSVHGIANTALLATSAEVATAKSQAVADAATAADTAIATAVDTAINTHNSDETNVHGIANTADLATASSVASAIEGHNSDQTNVHGIEDITLLATASSVATAITAHNAETTDVHGIADTADLVTSTQLANAIASAASDQTAFAGVGIDWNTTSEAFDIDETVATKTYADTAVSDHNSDTTNVHGISDTSLLATTADVAAVTKTSLGLGNVDNTADASKPVSTAQATAIETAKSEAIASATAQVDALLTGAPEALNTLDELAAALGDDANFAASVTTSLGLKVDSLTPISKKTASYTLSSLTERDDLIEMGSASAMTLTIPSDATLNFPIGTSVDILQTSTGQVTIAGSGFTPNATPGLKLRTQWSSCTLLKRAANTWVVFGDLSA